jgi:hypothetical protein
LQDMMEWWNAFNDMISSAKEYSLVMLKSYWVNVGTSEIDLCGNQKVCKLYYRTTTLDFMLGAKVKHKSPRSGGISPLSLLRDDMKLKKLQKYWRWAESNRRRNGHNVTCYHYTTAPD